MYSIDRMALLDEVCKLVASRQGISWKSDKNEQHPDNWIASSPAQSGTSGRIFSEMFKMWFTCLQLKNHSAKMSKGAESCMMLFSMRSGIS